MVSAMADPKYQMTRESLEALEAELHLLENDERAAIAARIKTAREWGDLKENAEYHDAKNSQAHLETKILRLRDQTRNAVVVESAAGGDRAGIGSTVTAQAEGAGAPREYVLVTPSESDPAAGRLSIDSPLGHALAGASVGAVVEYETPKGTRRLTVTHLA